MLKKITVLILGISLSTFSLNAQSEADIYIEKINEQFYKIQSVRSAERISNVYVFTGDEGGFVFDAGYNVTAQKLDSTVRLLTNNNIKYLANSHFHSDHMGANHLLGKDAIVIGHQNLRKELTSGIKMLQEIPHTAIPEITFQDSLSLHLNNEEIKLYHQPYSHTHSDVIVHFKKMGILCMGDLLAADIIPFSDVRNGSRILKYIKNVNNIIRSFPDTTLFLGGHGRKYTKTDLKQYITKLSDTYNVVAEGLKQGKSVEDMQKEKILQNWEYMAKGIVKCDTWIAMIAYCEENKVHILKKSLIAPLYHALKEENGNAAIEKYKQIKQNYPDEYAFNVNILIAFGYYLIRNEMIEDAIEAFKLNVEEYPSSSYAFESLADAYLRIDDKDNAKINLKKALEINPNNERIKNILNSL